MASYSVKVTYGGASKSETVEPGVHGAVLRQDTGGTEYERFETLTRNLLSVSKDDLEEQRESASSS